MQTFQITLKNEKERTYRLIILFFVVLHVVFFIYLLFNEHLWKIGVTGLVLTLLYSGYRLLITNTSRQKFSYGSAYFFVISYVSLIDNWWFFGIEMVLLVLSTIALTPLLLSFTSAGVKKEGIPFTKYQWGQFSNVILKDNLLTLDFKNNRLLQSEIDTKNINEDAFNTFAREQLNKT